MSLHDYIGHDGVISLYKSLAILYKAAPLIRRLYWQDKRPPYIRFPLYSQQTGFGEIFVLFCEGMCLADKIKYMEELSD